LAAPRPVPVLRFFDRVLPKFFGFNPAVDTSPPGFEGRPAPHGLEGLTDMEAKIVWLPPQTYARLEAGGGRPKFTAAHEIGHVVLHRNELHTSAPWPNGGVVFARRTEIDPYEDPEWQANNFASALLMPATALVQLERTHGEVTDTLIHETLEVSLTSARLRLKIFNQYRAVLVGVASEFLRGQARPPSSG
jgi:hypothetical protein